LPESNPTNPPQTPQPEETVPKAKWDEAATGMIKQMANGILDTTGAEVVMLLVQWDHDTKQIVALKRELPLDRLIQASLSIVNGMSEVGLKALCMPEPEEEEKKEEAGG
jgi:hypothetical protein